MPKRVALPGVGVGGRSMNRADHGQHPRHALICQVEKRPFSLHPEQVKTATASSPLPFLPGFLPQRDGKGGLGYCRGLERQRLCLSGPAARPQPSPHSVMICPIPLSHCFRTEQAGICRGAPLGALLKQTLCGLKKN